MDLTNLIVGLPWQLAKQHLQAANVPFTTIIGQNFNRFFDVSAEGLYVARVKIDDDGIYNVLLYRPMKNSEFEKLTEVQYAEDFTGKTQQ